MPELTSECRLGPTSWSRRWAVPLELVRKARTARRRGDPAWFRTRLVADNVPPTDLLRSARRPCTCCLPSAVLIAEPNEPERSTKNAVLILHLGCASGEFDEDSEEDEAADPRAHRIALGERR